MTIVLNRYSEAEKDEMFIKLISKYRFGLTTQEIIRKINRKSAFEIARRLARLAREKKLREIKYGTNKLYRTKKGKRVSSKS